MVTIQERPIFLEMEWDVRKGQEGPETKKKNEEGDVEDALPEDCQVDSLDPFPEAAIVHPAPRHPGSHESHHLEQGEVRECWDRPVCQSSIGAS